MASSSGSAVARPRVRPLELTGLVLAVAGLLVSAYLTYEHYTSSTSLACPETSTVNCAKVTTSHWSTFAGLPVALLGLLFYVVMVALMTPNQRFPRDAVRRTRLVVAAVGVCFAVYLVWAELFRVNAICLWCTGVHVITVALFAVLAFDLAMGEEI